MKILFVAAEANPIAKVGGLADVVSALPRMLNVLGHDVRIVIPKYGCIDDSLLGKVDAVGDLSVNISNSINTAAIKVTEINGGTITYLVDNDTYFAGQNIYTDNDLEKFYYFCKVVVSLMSVIDWKPDIIHCHDWHTGLIPMWLKLTKQKISSVYTIHNLAYQGYFGDDFLAYSGLEKEWKSWPDNSPAPQKSFMSHGIVWSDVITTVSRNYAREILTPEYGCGLESFLQFYQRKLTGIVNGIDTEIYDPSTDFSIVENYNASTIEKKVQNKFCLQQKVGFIHSEAVPLIGMVTRLVQQKGIDILIEGIESLLKMNMQLFILGKGSPDYEKMLCTIAEKHHDKMVFFPEVNEDFADQVYAGSDMFLMPSQFEPCGLGQLIAMRYGTVPIVRSTGGLADTVENYNAELETGNGFTFNDYTSSAMLDSVKRAIAIYKEKDKWLKLSRNIMRIDYSWRSSAIAYEEIYNMLARNHER